VRRDFTTAVRHITNANDVRKPEAIVQAMRPVPSGTVTGSPPSGGRNLSRPRACLQRRPWSTRATSGSTPVSCANKRRAPERAFSLTGMGYASRAGTHGPVPRARSTTARSDRSGRNRPADGGETQEEQEGRYRCRPSTSLGLRFRGRRPSPMGIAYKRKSLLALPYDLATRSHATSS